MGSRVDDKQLLGDVVASVVEKTLMKIDIPSYQCVSDILETHSLKFSDLYQNPEVLMLALREAFGDEYVAAVQKIKNGFGMHAYENHNLAKFIDNLGK